jgi:uncharacterized protein (TIGR03089 family)
MAEILPPVSVGPVTARTFPDLLADRLRRDPGQPLVTMYDDATGERTELSVATYANWVSKNANLLTEELDLAAGDTLLLDLPVHWLVPVFLGAAWTAGIAVTTDPEVDHDVLVCGPNPPTSWPRPVVACSLLPFAVRFREPLAAPVLDHGVLWPGQPDIVVGIDPVGADTVAWRGADGDVAQADLLDRAAAVGDAPGTRLLTDVHPADGGGTTAFLAPLVAGGSLVLVRHPDDDGWPARQEAERADVVRRVSPSS